MMNRKQYDYAVIFGRFQPFHLGHLSLCLQAAQCAERLIVVIGSVGASLSVRNPWNGTERCAFIAAALRESGLDDFQFLPIADSAYHFSDWLLRLKAEIAKIVGKKSFAIVGHYRDKSSYYLDHFPGWEVVLVPEQFNDISSTVIRKFIFTGNVDAARPYLPPIVYSNLVPWLESPEYARLKTDFVAIQTFQVNHGISDKSSLASIVIVVHSRGEILFMRRNDNPGQNLWSLPECLHIPPDSDADSAALSLLRQHLDCPLPDSQYAICSIAKEPFDAPARDIRGPFVATGYFIDLDLAGIQCPSPQPEDVWLPVDLLKVDEAAFFIDHALIARHFLKG
jgi:bifunctional NMN adenylyltransferase/nudix hydrolase